MHGPLSFRERRWCEFECGFRAWLETPEGRFEEYCARRGRAEAERRALLRRVALASTVLPPRCVGCALRLALTSSGAAAACALDEILRGGAGPARAAKA